MKWLRSEKDGKCANLRGANLRDADREVLTCKMLTCEVLTCEVLTCKMLTCEMLTCEMLTCRVLTCKMLTCKMLTCEVDDGAENRELVRLVLESAGLTVLEACDGAVALDVVEREAPDLVLMDVNMPVMDGYTATRLLRERGCTLPVLALTANAMKGFEHQIEGAAGFTGYLTKPVDIDALLAELAAHLGGRQVAGVLPERSPVVVAAAAAAARRCTSRRRAHRFPPGRPSAPVARGAHLRPHAAGQAGRDAVGAGRQPPERPGRSWRTGSRARAARSASASSSSRPANSERLARVGEPA